MKIGPAVRKMMPPGVERKLSGLYRAVFVDLDKVANCLAESLPRNAHLLDIGGGDGELINCLLSQRDDLRVAMVDVAQNVGTFVSAEHRSRISVHPGTSVEDHVARRGGCYDAALISDVLHHLPRSYRGDFIATVRSGLKREGEIYVKDIQPGHFIAWLSLMCDRYVSGDRETSLVSKEELCLMLQGELAGFDAVELGLQQLDPPNYLIKFKSSNQGGP